ncbi:MAG: DUF4373 domain-containing protein [Chlorobium sp.]|jgi:hypothetical protein|nr:DUF4373 domain-containing protein [Chlorobium sp.]
MTNSKTGLNYFNIETDRYQDIRIKRLKKDFSCVGVAIYDYILCEIYRVRGCFIEWDESTAFDVAEYYGIKESVVMEVVNYCCAVGLFNRELLTNGRILTSLSIQKRYLEMCKRAKRSDAKIPNHVKIREECAKLPEESPKLPEKTANTPAVCPKVKYSKVKKSKVESELSREHTPTRAEIDFKKFQKWITENALQVSKMKEPFTISEFEKLKSDFDVGFIQNLLTAMHNHKPLLQKNINANLTFRNWAKRETNGQTIKPTSKASDIDAVVGAMFQAAGVQ